MADLSRVAEAIPGGGVRKYRGTVVTVGGLRMVNVDGQNLRATWADPIVVDDGDVVDVELSGASEGLATVHVPARTTAQPRPKTGIVSLVPSSSPTIRVDAGGLSYDAEFIGTYAVNDRVHLDWGAGRPRVMGKVTTTPAPPTPPILLPPAPVVTGSSDSWAAGSGTFSNFGWDNWAGGGENIFQGDYGGGPLVGAWFYGGVFGNLAGRTITRVRFRTGARRAVGDYRSPAAFRFYAHTSPGRPGGNVNLVAGPVDRVIGPGSGPIWIDLPASFGAAVVAGGGIAVSGGPYASMVGRLGQADSGALILDWKK